MSFKASWVEVSVDCDFTIANIPFGVYKAADGNGHIATAIGNFVVDLNVLASKGLMPASCTRALQQSVLNDFMSLSRPIWKEARNRIQSLLACSKCEGTDATLRDNADLQKECMFPLSSVEMLLPANIGDYTDFYSSREHATNVGIMFRDPTKALLPNWLHLPVGYHGRASSVVVSGTDFRRPCGQLQAVPTDESQGSIYGASKQLDFELEMAFFVGNKGNALGDTISITDAEEYIFGFTLMNDWSARDIQKWEYVPLGPFGAKNFCTTISPWIVTLEALEPYRCTTSAGEQKEPVPLPYLRDPNYGSYDVDLTVTIKPHDASDQEVTVSKSNYRYMYWSPRQQLVHHTVTGCNMRPGDLLGSGTISGPTPDSYGSMLELAWKGTKPLPFPNNTTRVFLQDGDEVIMRGHCVKEGVGRIGFGECKGKILPAKPVAM